MRRWILFFSSACIILIGLSLRAAQEKQLPCLIVRSAEGALIRFYPEFLDSRELWASIEESTWRVKGAYIVLPLSLAEREPVEDCYHLPTKEGPYVVIKRWDSSWREVHRFFSVSPLPKTVTKKTRLRYTIKTLSGPDIPIELTLRKYRYSWPKKGLSQTHSAQARIFLPDKKSFPEPTPHNLPTIANPSDPDSIFDAIAQCESIDVQTRLEARLYKLGKKILPTTRKRLEDPHTRVRESACVLLRWFPEKKSISTVAPLIGDTSLRVAREARYTLNFLLLTFGKESVDVTSRQRMARQTIELLAESQCSNESLQKADVAQVLPFLTPWQPEFSVDSGGFGAGTTRCRRKFGKLRVEFLRTGDRSWRQRGKEDWIPLIQFLGFQRFGDFARVAARLIPTQWGHEKMNWVALYQKSSHGWQLLEFPPYHNRNHKMVPHHYGPISNLAPVRSRLFSDLGPAGIEQFELGMQAIRLNDVESKLFERNLFQFEWARHRHMRYGESRGLGPEYIPHLRKYLGDTSEILRFAAALALEQLKQNEAKPIIKDLCKKSVDKKLKGFCYPVLEDEPTDPVDEKKLLELMATVPKGAHCGTGVPWYSFMRKQQAPETIKTLIRLYRQSPDETVRRHALSCLSHQKRADLVPFWKAVLKKSSVPNAFYSAFQALTTINSEESRAFLMETMRNKTSPEDHLVAIASSLTHLRSVSVEDYDYTFLGPLLTHSSDRVREAAYRASLDLAGRGVPLELIKSALRDKSAAVVIQGLQRVGYIAQPELIPLILPHLRSESLNACLAADRALHTVLYKSLDREHDRYLLLRDARNRKEWRFIDAPVTAMRLATVLERDGYFEEAADAYEAVQKVCNLGHDRQCQEAKRHGQPLYRLFEIKRKLGDIAGARKVVKRFLDEFPHRKKIQAKGLPGKRHGLFTGTPEELADLLLSFLDQPIALTLSPKRLASRGEKTPIQLTITNKTGRRVKIRTMTKDRDGNYVNVSFVRISHECRKCSARFDNDQLKRLREDFTPLDPGGKFKIDGVVHPHSRRSGRTALTVTAELVIELDNGKQQHLFADSNAAVLEIESAE